MNKEELNVEVAGARLDAAKAKAVRAEKVWKRAKALIPDNAISDDETDEKECNHYVAQAELREAEANVKIAELELAKTTKAPGQGTATRLGLSSRKPQGGKSPRQKKG